MNKEEILEHEHNYILWLDALQEFSEERAMLPYAEGKWSPNEIVMHLAEWDRFTIEERLPYMKEGEKLEAFPNFESFNAKVAARAHEQTFKETLAYAKKQRQFIIEQLRQTDEVDWGKEFSIGTHTLSIRKYFADFIDHDLHHQNQISNK